MIRPDQTPDEAVEAAARTLAGSAQLNLMAWNAHARAAIAAALNAWPGCYFVGTIVSPVGRATHNNIILPPLPQEPKND